MKWYISISIEYWFNTEEAIGMRKVLPHDVKMQKNPQTKEGTSWIFTNFHGVMRLQSPNCTAAQKFHQWKSFIHAATFSNTLYWLIFFKKNTYFERKFIKYLMELTWVGNNHLKVFWKMDALSSCFLGGLIHFYQFEFYLH